MDTNIELPPPPSSSSDVEPYGYDNVNDVDDNDDDYDDNINIVLDSKTETDLIDKIAQPTTIDTASDGYSSDIALQSEINALIRKSINIKNTNTITVMCQNQMLILENNTQISSRLASMIWGTPLMYQKNLPANIETLNEFIGTLQDKCSMKCTDTYCDGTNIAETVGLFAATYRKNATSIDSSDRHTRMQQHQHQQSRRTNNNIGLYRYYDFTLLILKNGKIIDYAIHGVRSNINDAIAEHKPSKIYCNVMQGDALDTFLRYECQPFYGSMYGRMHRLKLNILDMYNFLWFCERSNSFCSFCLALKYLCALIVVNPEHQQQQPTYHQESNVNDRHNRVASVIVVPKRRPHQHQQRQHNYCKNRNFLNQPNNNTRRITLKRAPKKTHFPSTESYNFTIRQTNKSQQQHHQPQHRDRSRKIETSMYCR